MLEIQHRVDVARNAMQLELVIRERLRPCSAARRMRIDEPGDPSRAGCGEISDGITAFCRHELPTLRPTDQLLQTRTICR